MMVADNYLISLAVLLIVSGLCGFAVKKILHLPSLFGYIFSGVVLNLLLPAKTIALNSLWFHPLNETAVLILLFSIGLHFDLSRLRRMGLSPLVIGVLQTLFLWVATTQLGRWLPVPSGNSPWLWGACLLASSTIVAFKTLKEHQLQNARIGEKLMGVLLIEDISTMMIVMGMTLHSGVSDHSNSFPLWMMILIFIGALISLWLVGSVFLPKLLNSVAMAEKDTDLALILALGLCLASAAFAMLNHASGAIGAFLMGCILSESQYARKLEVLIRPIGDIGAMVFFVGVGFTLSLPTIASHFHWILLIACFVMCLKILYNFLLHFVFGSQLTDAFRMALYMGQVGEMTFIIGRICLENHIFSKEAYAILCTVSVCTMLVNPLYMKKMLPLSNQFDQYLPRSFYKVLTLYTQSIRLFSFHEWVLKVEKKSLRIAKILNISKTFQDKLAQHYKIITASNLSSTLSRLAPWDEYIVPIQLDATSDLSGKSLKDLDIRSRFSVTIIAIERQERILVAPSPEEIFMYDDLLYVYGQEEPILAFEKVCLGGKFAGGVRSHHIESSMDTCVLGHVRLHEGHLFVNKNLQSVALREKHACLLLAVSRGATRIKNPQANFIFQANDDLYIFGYASAIKNLS